MANYLLNSRFPDDNLNNKEKEDISFGKQVGQAISNQWYTNSSISYRRSWIQKMRQYSRGEQTTDYRTIIEGKNHKKDVKTHKIDYDNLLKVMPTFKDIVINPIDESLFVPKAESIDATSIDERKSYFRKLEKAFYTKDIMQEISQLSGMNMVDPETPQSEKELNIKKLEYKPMIELAQELAISEVMKHQEFEKIKDKVDEDLFDLGIGVARHYTDVSEGIVFKYVDPYDFIHSTFEYEDARDLRYAGIWNKGTFADLEKECGGLSFETKERILKAVKNNFNKKQNVTGTTNGLINQEDEERTLEWVSFAYKTSLKRVFKRQRTNNSIVLIDRTNDEGTDMHYTPSNPSKRMDVPYYVWFKGIYIPDADECVQWKLIENQIDEGVNNAMCPFVVYAPKVKRLSETGYVRFDSMTARAIPIIDDIQTDWFKFQQLKHELRPNTVEIDTDALNEVMLGAEKISPQDLLNMFFGRGLLLKRSTNDDGEPMTRAITENNGGVNNSSLTFLANELSNNLSRLRQVLGINEIRDGSANTNARTAASIQKILAASSNNATNHIVRGSFAISLKFATATSLRLIDVLSTSALKDMYINIIGRENTEVLSIIEKIPMRRFGIYFDFKPDDEDRQTFEQALIDAYSKGELNAAQYLKARAIKNVKNAIKYMEIVIEENMARKEMQQIKAIEANAEANARTTVISEQAKQQTETIKFEAESTIVRLKAQLDNEANRLKALSENALAQEEHIRKMERLRLEQEVLSSKIVYQEDQKNKREDQRAANQSKLIDKRKFDKEPSFGESINDIFANSQQQFSPQPEQQVVTDMDSEQPMQDDLSMQEQL